MCAILIFLLKQTDSIFFALVYIAVAMEWLHGLQRAAYMYSWLGRVFICPPSSLTDLWTENFDPGWDIEEVHTVIVELIKLCIVIIIYYVYQYICRFVITVPAVTAPSISVHTYLHTPTHLNNYTQLTERIARHLAPHSSILHFTSTNMTLQFPETRLIQYDCGKLKPVILQV